MPSPAGLWFRIRAIIVALLGVTVLVSCDRADTEAEPSQPPRDSRPANEVVVPESTADEVNHSDVEAGWVAPASHWIETKKRVAEKVLEYAVFDLIVLPVQAHENPFDPIERSLITRLVSDRIAATSDIRVANPTYVIRTLGLHRAEYPARDVQSLVKQTHPNKLLVLTAEHDRNGKFEFGVSLVSAWDGTTLAGKTWSDLDYGDAYPPSVAIEAILPEIAALVTGDEETVKPTVVDFDVETFRFPPSAEALTEQARVSPLASAAYLQLLGVLHPPGSYNESRNGLFERSLVELQRVSPKSDHYRYFKARAYAFLDRRPAAIKALRDPRNSHERALLAAMNGNLPELRREVQAMGTSALDYMSWKDLLEIEYRYKDRRSWDVLDQFIEENPTWAAFIYRSLRDRIDWADYSPATLKLGLEQLLPADVPTLESTIATAGATTDIPTEFELTRLLWRHLDAIESENALAWAYDPQNHVTASGIDILDLAKSYAVANHVRLIEDDLSRRVVPENALSRINEFNSIYSGHPVVTLQKARALSAIRDKTRGGENRTLSIEANDTFLNGYAWTGQLTADAVDVLHRYSVYLETGSFADRFRSASKEARQRFRQPARWHEWPKGSVWYKKFTHSDIENGALERCIDYEWTAYFCLDAAIDRAQKSSDSPELVRAEYLAKYADRYHGHPSRTQSEVKVARDSSDEDAELRLLTQRIEAGNTDWGMYYALGRMYKRRGDYQKAQEVWLSFPGFRQGHPTDSVSLSNHANLAGSMFYWIGQYELALPLLEISANSGSGSANSMSAACRIALINGDFAEAERWAAARVRRYGSGYAARDLQQLLHITGRSDLAWSVFEQMQATRPGVQIWSGALVGHRMQAKTTEDITAWLESTRSSWTANSIYDADNHRIWPATRYLLLAGTMDRVPKQDFAASFDKLQPWGLKPRYVPRGGTRTAPGLPLAPTAAKGVEPAPESHVDSADYYLVDEFDRRVEHDANIPAPGTRIDMESDQEIQTRYQMIAHAMTAFLNQDYDAAFQRFNEAAHSYPLGEYLPYFAFSAAAVDRAAHLPGALQPREARLDEIRREEKFESSELGYRFDEDLTYAVLASFDGRHDDAMQRLRDALNNRPYLDERTIYPMYAIVDLADRLYDRTKVNGYRKFALEVSRRHTVVLPMYTWAYFVVAKYSKSETERVTAAASGLHLDPLSHRAAGLPGDLLDKARSLLDKGGPPYLRRSDGSATIGT